MTTGRTRVRHMEGRFEKHAIFLYCLVTYLLWTGFEG